MPLCSVVMGAYQISNLPLFYQAVDSVLTQSVQDFEFIICDDGSSDETYFHLLAVAEKDPRIKILQNETNHGLAYSLNRCIQVSSGQYIMRQDVDDLSHPERLRRQLDFLEQHPEIHFVGSHIGLFDSRGLYGARQFPAYPQKEDFCFVLPFLHGSILFRRDALERVGSYRVSKVTRRTEDYELIMRMYANGMRGANLQEILYDFCEDISAMRRRKYIYRIDEAIIRYQGFSQLGLLPRKIFYVIKPLVVGLIPIRLLLRLKQWAKRPF